MKDTFAKQMLCAVSGLILVACIRKWAKNADKSVHMPIYINGKYFDSIHVTSHKDGVVYHSIYVHHDGMDVKVENFDNLEDAIYTVQEIFR